MALAGLHRAAAGSPRAERALDWAGWWARPLASGLLAHLLLGPKQRRPVYLRVPGAMYAYAGVKVDRNAGCRGGCVTGATGSGKTLACIIPRLHSLCVNESGAERPGWASSRERRDLERARRDHRALMAQARAEIARLAAPACGPAPDPACADGSEERIAGLRRACEQSAQSLQEASDPCRRLRYRIPPWGGFVCGEKGNEWQAVESLLCHHGRDEDLCVLRTRPSWAPPGWTPSVRLNLISMDEVPADTLARMLVDTGLAVEEAGTRDEFFIPQARDKIAWGIRLVRAVKASCGAAPGPQSARDTAPSLLTLFDVLTVHESYRRYLARCSAAHPGLSASDAFSEARFQ